MLIRITIVAALAAVGSLPVISALYPVEFADLNIPCTGDPRFGDFSPRSGSFCENLPTCLINGGRKIGYCTTRGICCLVTATCGKTISTIFGYFVSTDYPSGTVSTSGDCTVTIRPFDDRVCQVRLDFEDFVLAQPDTTGHCVTDSFEVIGSDFNYPVPIICGINNGQHMYLNYAGEKGDIRLRIRATNRRWRIRITQIRCSNFAALAPAGCLQYFTGVSGTVSSFNFVPVTSPRGQNLALQDYEVCLNPTTTSCNFTWNTDSNRFSITDDTKQFVSFQDSYCLNENLGGDYISILGGNFVVSLPGPGPAITRRDLHCTALSSTPPTVITLMISTILSERMRVFFNGNADTTSYGFQFTFNVTCT